MTYTQLPLYAETRFSYRSALAGFPYSFLFRYSERNEKLYVDVFEAETDNPLIQGQALEPRAPVRLAAGVLLVLEGPSDWAFDDLGNGQLILVVIEA